MSYWIDSHTHLIFDEFKDNFDSYIQRAFEQNVRRMMVVCLNIEQLQRAYELKEQYSFFDIAIGYFPLDVPKLTEKDWQDLEEAVQDPRVVAIGEIGLDYFLESSRNCSELQKEAMIRQIDLANKLNKPILVHSRDAHEDMVELLQNHPPKCGGIMHCFSGGLEVAKKLAPLGFVFALGGPLTYDNLDEGKDVVQGMGLEYLQIETDCPSLPPQQHANEINETSYAHYSGEVIAKLKGIDVETVQKQLQINYERLFGKL